MTDKDYIRKVVEAFIGDGDLYLVDVRVSSTMRITVLIDKKAGGVEIGECARVSKHLEEHLDREKQDYELQVSSPGLEMPFLVHQQYIKNEGRKVEVLTAAGEKHAGILRNVTTGGFELEIEVKQKGKQVTLTSLSFNFEDIKSVKTIIGFK